jgi:hypothetical protein
VLIRFHDVNLSLIVLKSLPSSLFQVQQNLLSACPNHHSWQADQLVMAGRGLIITYPLLNANPATLDSQRDPVHNTHGNAIIIQKLARPIIN